MAMKKLTAGMFVAVTIMTSTGQSQTNIPAKSSWTNNVTIKGDVRFRHEIINDDSKLNSDNETYTRQRDRIRARLGVEAKVNDNAKLGIAFSTGQNDPVSGNQTIGDAWQKKDIRLDQAFFDWSLIKTDPTLLNLVGGKQKNPFMPFGNVSDLVWDPDVTPEGLVLKGQTGNDKITIGSSLGYLWIQERSANSDDSLLYAGQGFVKFLPMSEVTLTLGGTYYGYQNIQGKDVIDWENKNNAYGNSTTKGSVSGSTTNKAWASEFNPVELFASLDVFTWRLPVSIYGQTVKNNDASTSFDSGFLYGISLGKAKSPKTYELGYSYAKLEKDAVLGALTDSDRWGGGTDGKGHKIYGKYVIAKNFQVGLTYFLDDKTISEASKTRDYSRMQADLMYSF
jgi:hypothetical protein